MWRLGRNCLPNRQRLISKGIDFNSNCVICQTYIEYFWHLFLSCADIVSCWRKLGLWPTLKALMDNAESFYDVFVKVLQILTTDQIVLLAMTSWSIWRKRSLQL
jgi:hypothetical protein